MPWPHSLGPRCTHTTAQHVPHATVRTATACGLTSGRPAASWRPTCLCGLIHLAGSSTSAWHAWAWHAWAWYARSTRQTGGPGLHVLTGAVSLPRGTISSVLTATMDIYVWQQCRLSCRCRSSCLVQNTLLLLILSQEHGQQL